MAAPAAATTARWATDLVKTIAVFLSTVPASGSIDHRTQPDCSRRIDPADIFCEGANPRLVLDLLLRLVVDDPCLTAVTSTADWSRCRNPSALPPQVAEAPDNWVVLCGFVL